MIVSDFYVKCVARDPAKANSPLIVNSNTVLTLVVATELFESISWRSLQIIQ